MTCDFDVYAVGIDIHKKVIVTAQTDVDATSTYIPKEVPSCKSKDVYIIKDNNDNFPRAPTEEPYNSIEFSEKSNFM